MEINLQRTNHEQINEMITKFEQDHLVHFRQVHRMIDLFETIIKTNTAILLANYFQVNKISDEVAKKLVQGMYTPSLGTWLGFNEVVFEQLAFNHVAKDVYETIYHSAQQHDREKMDLLYKNENNTYVFLPKDEQGSVKGKGKFLNRLFHHYYRNHQADKDKAFTHLGLPSFYETYRTWHNMASNQVVKFRNEYAHGATPTEEECLLDIQNNLENLKESLSLSWLHDTCVIVFSEDLQRLEIGAEWTNIESLHLDETPEPHIPYLVLPDNSLLRLFPLVTYQPITSENKQSISFFNDLKGVHKSEISYLNYPYAEHIRDDVIYSQFIEVFRLEEWRKNLLSDFEDLMLRLQESFKGRTDELAYLQTFVERNNRGFLYVYGIPGIGKSALVANAFHEPKEKQTIIKYFIRNRRYTHVTEVLDYLNRTIDQMYRQQIQLSLGLGDTEEEKKKLLHERLQLITSHLVSNNEKLIIMIDGLDEGDQALLNNLLFETYMNVLVIYVARQTPEVTAFINDLPLDYLTKKEIGKISTEDIRAMLYEVVNKYNVTESYVQAIAEKSDGHPLYVRLLCDALVEYPEKLNDEHYLPEKWEEFYKRFFDRFIEDEHGDLVLEGLFVFAAAKDYLSRDQIRFIFNSKERRINAQEILIIFNRLSELLIESLEQRQHYQLFHKTFHEYIMEHYAFDIMDTEDKILKYCMDWESLDKFGESMVLYPLQYLSVHLREKNDLVELETLVHHEKFIDKQITTTGKFTASFMLLEAYRSVAYEQGNEVALIDAMIQLMKLNGRLRSSGMKGEQSVRYWTVTDWKNELQNLHFYDQMATGRQLYINLWESLEKNSDELQKITLEIDRVLSKDTNVFNWVEYVPISLLVHLSAQLEQKAIDSSFILNRIATVEGNLRDVLGSYPLTELSVPILRALIDRVIYPDLSPWSSLMVQLIIRLREHRLDEFATNYEVELMEQIDNSSNRYLDEQSLERLAIYYINNDAQEKGFSLLSEIQDYVSRQQAYRRIYESYEVSDRQIAEQAYELGVGFLQDYAGEDRIRYVVDWLPATLKENKTEYYDKLLLEVELAIDESDFHLQYGALEHIAYHFWHRGEYERAITVINEMDVTEIRDELFCEFYTLSETDENCPSTVKQALYDKYVEIETGLFTNVVVWPVMYDKVIHAVIARWIQQGETEKINELIERYSSFIDQGKLFIRMLDEHAKIAGLDKVIEFALELPFTFNNHHLFKDAINWFLQGGMIEEILRIIEEVEVKINTEELVKYGAIEALKTYELELFHTLFAKLKNPLTRQFVKFEQVYTYGFHCRWDEAVQLLEEVKEEMPIADTIPHDEIDELVVQRMFNQGDMDNAFQFTDDESLKDSERYFVEETIVYHLLRNELTEAFTHYDRTFNILPHVEDIEFYQHDIDGMLSEIVMRMARFGNREVIAILDKVDNASLRLSPRVASLFNKRGLSLEADQIITQYEKRLQCDMEGVQENPVTLYNVTNASCHLSNYYFERGDTSQAEAILRTVIDNYSNNKTTTKLNKGRAYFSIAYECRKQKLDDLLNIIEPKYKALVNNENISSIWSEYISLLIRDHQFDKALANFEKATFKSASYQKLVSELILIQDTDRLLQTYEALQSEFFTEYTADYLANQKAILRYLLDVNEEGKMYELIQSEQNVYNRIELYEEILPGITKEKLALFLNQITQEQNDVKRHLEKKLLYHSISEPNFTAKQLRQIMSRLSVEKETTALALYVYWTFKKHRFDDSIEDTLVEKIADILQL